MEPVIFRFQNRVVRQVTVNGELCFVAKDVAESLGYKWSGTSRIAHVPEEWRRVTSVVTLRGDAQDMAVLTEQGLYFFLGRSDKPAAIPFQKWLAGEVLPSIRKTGAYVSPAANQVETKPPINVSIVAGDFDEKDRPVAVATKLGTAYFNWPTYMLIATARANPQSDQHVLLTSAMAASKEMVQSLPEPLRTIQKLKNGMLETNKFWSDLHHCLRMGLTVGAIARVCGCHPSTVRRNLKKMKAVGLFDDPLKGMTSEMCDLLLPPKIED